MAKKSYDWVAIKVQFINSSLTVQEFADKFSIPYGTLKKQATQGKWLDERSAIGAETIRKSTEISTDIRAYQLTELENEHIKLAQKAQSKLHYMLDTADNANQVSVVSTAMVNLQKVYRLALGASTENQATQEVSDFNKWLEDIKDEQGRNSK